MKYLSLILTLATAINIYGADGANIQWSAHPYSAGMKSFCQFDCRIENQGNENMWLWFVNPDNPHRTEEVQAYEFMHRLGSVEAHGLEMTLRDKQYKGTSKIDYKR